MLYYSMLVICYITPCYLFVILLHVSYLFRTRYYRFILQNVRWNKNKLFYLISDTFPFFFTERNIYMFNNVDSNKKLHGSFSDNLRIFSVMMRPLFIVNHKMWIFSGGKRIAQKKKDSLPWNQFKILTIFHIKKSS